MKHYIVSMQITGDMDKPVYLVNPMPRTWHPSKKRALVMTQEQITLYGLTSTIYTLIEVKSA